MISFSIIDINYFYGSSEDDPFDWISFFALCISIFTVFISVRSIYLAKQEEIRYKRFEDLCLSPVQSELDRIYSSLLANQHNQISTFLGQINDDQRSFSLLLTRIRRVFNNIDVDHLHNIYLDFSDICFNEPVGANISNVLEEFQILRVDIIDHLYDNALTRKNWFGKSKVY